jgi:hypothetical protein
MKLPISGLLFLYALSLASLGLLYCWARQNHRKGARRHPHEVSYREAPAAGIVSVADSLLALNRALETPASERPSRSGVSRSSGA